MHAHLYTYCRCVFVCIYMKCKRDVPHSLFQTMGDTTITDSLHSETTTAHAPHPCIRMFHTKLYIVAYAHVAYTITTCAGIWKPMRVASRKGNRERSKDLRSTMARRRSYSSISAYSSSTCSMSSEMSGAGAPAAAGFCGVWGGCGALVKRTFSSCSRAGIL